MVLSYNEEGERAECWPLDRVLGQPHDLFYPPDEIAAGRPGADLAAALHEGTLEREAWRVWENGAEYLAGLTTTAPFEGAPHRAFARLRRECTADAGGRARDRRRVERRVGRGRF